VCVCVCVELGCEPTREEQTGRWCERRSAAC